MTGFHPRPTRPSALGSLAAGLVAVATAAGEPVALAVAAGGLVALAAGLVRGVRGWVGTGALGLFVGVLVVTLRSPAAVPAVVGTAASLVAWDLGEHAVGTGEHLGRAAATRGQEAVHLAGSLGVGAVAVVVALAVGRAGTPGLPLAALLAALTAALVLLAALRL